MKRFVVISDLHCGHRVGITPEQYQHGKKFIDAQKEMWGIYKETIKKLQPIDLLGVNGDAIDGHGKRSGGSELIITDIDEQCDMAIEVIKEANPKDIICTFGTP